jgi:Glycosyltransferase family 87
VIAALLIVASGFFIFKVSGKMPDFEVYWRAGMRAAAAEPLYRAEDGHYQFKYLPAFAVLVAPLTAIAPTQARALWFAVSAVLLVMLIHVSLRLLPDRRKASWHLVAITVAVMGKFYGRELLLGQVNLLFIAAAAGALYCLARNREGRGGALVALSIVLKPYGAILLPWLVARRQLQSIVAVSVGLVAALLLPAALYGVDSNIALHRDWWQTVVSTTGPNLLNPDNVSWLAMYSRWFGEGPLAGALTIVTCVFAIAAVAWVWAYRHQVVRPDGLEGALLLLAIPFVSPQGWDYVLLVATPAVMYLVNYEDRLPAPLRWITVAALATIGLTIFDVIGRAAYQRFMEASGITICFFVVAVALIALRLRRVV